ncbi:MAG: energy transducer TonB, partial [Fidelibacterota bacterium]
FLQTRESLVQRLLNLKKWKEGNVKVPAPKKQVTLIAGIMTAMLGMAFQCQTKDSPLGQQEAPPELAKDEGIEFVPYDTPPSPVGGFAAIQKQLIYPEESLKEGSQGTVILQLRVLADGTTAQVKLLKDSTGDPRLVEAAMEAVRRTTWNPAKAKGENVSVWISMPVNFRLP